MESQHDESDLLGLDAIRRTFRSTFNLSVKISFSTEIKAQYF